MDTLTNAPKLIITKGLTEETYSIVSNSVSIGRGLANEFRIVADGVSRLHARIVRDGDHYYLSDLQSTNGTFLNGRKVKAASKLQNGDTIELGRSVGLRFEIPSARFRQTDINELVRVSDVLNPAIKSEIGPFDEDSEPDFPDADKAGADIEFFRKGYERLAILYEVNSSVSSASNLDETLERIANIVLTLEKADRVAILLLDDATGKLKPVVFRDHGTDFPHKSVQISRTILEKTVSEGVGVLSADALSDPRFRSAKSVELQNVRSVICVPLKRQENVIGAIYVDCLFIHDGFDDEDLRLMMAISNEASIVVENVQLTERLVQAAKFSALGQFAAGIVHEIKNQLGAITLAELIREKYPDDERLLRYADILIEARDHLVGIVSEVRDFSKSTPSKYEKAPVPLVEIAESALSLIRFDKLFDQIDVLSEFTVKPVVLCNRGKIKQVLINVLQNAAYAAREGQNPQVRLEILEEPEFGLIRVTDNGCGIPPENMRKIWEPLFTTREDSGTGLGLDICRKIVEAHDGHIECQSPPKNSTAGTTFTVRLPLKK